MRCWLLVVNSATVTVMMMTPRAVVASDIRRHEVIDQSPTYSSTGIHFFSTRDATISFSKKTKMFRSTFLSVAMLVVLATNQSLSFMLNHPKSSSTARVGTSTLRIGNIFGGLFGQDNSNGPKAVVNLPASVVKVGPLKFFLQIYLVGEQNKPVKGAWVLSSNDERGSLDMYYMDGTGMFSIGLNDRSIKIDRYGERPSLEYMLQESVMIHGVLDELNQIAFEVEDIEKEKRLLQLTDDDAILKARETLPARKES